MNTTTKQEISPHCPYVMPTKKVESYEFTEFCNFKLGVSPTKIISDIERWLDEDHGAGDSTIFSAFNANSQVKFFIVAKENFILSCKPIMEQVFKIVSSGAIEIFSNFSDGDEIKKGDILLAGRGRAASVLLSERVALNFGCKMSGITTKTNNILKEIKKYNQSINLLETRKTTPGLRIYEKYSIRAAGARNHRHSLDSGAMLKENHLRSIGYIENALINLNENLPILSKAEVEVTNLNEFRTALEYGADVIMLDNFNLQDVKIAVQERNAANTKVKLELSGNLDEKNLVEIANCGVDYLSMGALIHKAHWVDMSMQVYKMN
jgi:nicotinate-nucleotide pyrophosphorylase (carboxylating)